MHDRLRPILLVGLLLSAAGLAARARAAAGQRQPRADLGEGSPPPGPVTRPAMAAHATSAGNSTGAVPANVADPATSGPNGPNDPDGPRSPDPDRGRQAERPGDIPVPGWKDVAVRVKGELKDDNVPLLGAGVAFFALLALVPALVAMVSIYGLFADPAEVERQISDVLAAAPREVRDLVEAQLSAVVSGEPAALGVGALVGVVAALWSASSGMKHLVEAINAAYNERETRKFFKLRGLSLLLTVGAVVFLVAAFALIAIVPALLEDTALGDASRIAVSILRFPALAAALLVGLAILYRYAPDRDEPQWRWASPGAIVATVLWVIGSLAFSLYTANFASYNETYGSLGAVVIVMLWLFLSAFIIVVGAEINSELERQTLHDTTEGRPEQLGRRDARAADTLGPTAEQARAARRSS